MPPGRHADAGPSAAQAPGSDLFQVCVVDDGYDPRAIDRNPA